MPNLVLMLVEDRDDKVVLGGYSSHGWVRNTSVSKVAKEMDLNLGIGGDESSFLFNITQNLRFEAIKHKNQYEMIYTHTAF